MNNIDDFIANIENETKKKDATSLVSILERISGYKPLLTGSIIGFGKYHYIYESGREGDSIVIGFSPRKQNIAVYIMPGFDQIEGLLQTLGKHKLGKSCLYINKLSDINIEVFEEIIKLSVNYMKNNYPCIDS